MRLPVPEVLQSRSTPSPPESYNFLKMEPSRESNNGTSSPSTPATFGMTGPISIASPKPFDLKLTRELEEALRPHGCFETMEEMTHRMEVLSKLDGLVKRWVYELSLLKNMPPAIAEQVNYLRFIYH